MTCMRELHKEAESLEMIDLIKCLCRSSPLPEHADTDFGMQDLVSMITRHRLSSALVQRYDSKSTWISKDVLRLLRVQGMAVAARVKEQVRAMSDISKECEQENIPVVFFKGSSSYLYTQDASYLRVSNDIDLATNDLRIIPVLIKLGYSFVDKTLPKHEYAVFKKESIRLDLHRSFPIPMLARHTRMKHVSPQLNTPHMIQDSLVEEQELPFGSLLVDSIVIGEGLGAGLRWPCITKSALVASINLYRDFRDEFQLFGDSDALVKFCHIRELAMLLRHPGFCPEYFMLVAKQHRAMSCVEFASQLLRLVYGEELLPESIQKQFFCGEHEFIVHIRGYMLAVDLSLEHFLNPRLTMNSVIDQLAVGKRALHEGGSILLWPLDQCTRALVRTDNSRRVDCRVSLLLEDGKLCLDVLVRDEKLWSIKLYIAFAGGRFTYVHNIARDTKATYGELAESICGSSEGEPYSCRFVFVQDVIAMKPLDMMVHVDLAFYSGESINALIPLRVEI